MTRLYPHSLSLHSRLVAMVLVMTSTFESVLSAEICGVTVTPHVIARQCNTGGRTIRNSERKCSSL